MWRVIRSLYTKSSTPRRIKLTLFVFIFIYSRPDPVINPDNSNPVEDYDEKIPDEYEDFLVSGEAR